jgi:hypothetical protein
MHDIVSVRAFRMPRALAAFGAFALLVASPRLASAAVTASLSGGFPSPHYGCPASEPFSGTITGAPGTTFTYTFNRYIDTVHHIGPGGSVTMPSSGSYPVNDAIPISTSTNGTTFDQIWVHNIFPSQGDVYSNEVHFIVVCGSKPTPKPTPKSKTLTEPTNLKYTIDAETCSDHGYTRSQCEQFIDDNLVLVWNWKPCGSCDRSVQGFKIYRVDRGHNEIVFFTLGGAKQTAVALLNPNGPDKGGYYNDHCYQVTAFQGDRQSQRSQSLCVANAGPQVFKVTPSSVVLKKHAAQHTGDPFALDTAGIVSCRAKQICVGFWDWDATHTLGDSWYNSYYRTQLAFNGVAFVARRITQATLELTRTTLSRGGKDAATYPPQCLGTVQSSGRMLPLASLQVSGHQVTLDVTSTVAPGRSAPQFIFVLTGPLGSENLKAFYNGSCLASFSKAVLDIHYVR